MHRATRWGETGGYCSQSHDARDIKHMVVFSLFSYNLYKIAVILRFNVFVNYPLESNFPLHATSISFWKLLADRLAYIYTSGDLAENCLVSVIPRDLSISLSTANRVLGIITVRWFVSITFRKSASIFSPRVSL